MLPTICASCLSPRVSQLSTLPKVLNKPNHDRCSRAIHSFRLKQSCMQYFRRFPIWTTCGHPSCSSPSSSSLARANKVPHKPKGPSSTASVPVLCALSTMSKAQLFSHRALTFSMMVVFMKLTGYIQTPLGPLSLQLCQLKRMHKSPHAELPILPLKIAEMFAHTDFGLLMPPHTENSMLRP